MPPCRFNHSSNLRVPIAKLWIAAGCGQSLPNVLSAKRLALTLPFQTQFFSDSRPPPDLKLENGIPVHIAILLSAALMWKGIFVVILLLTRLMFGRTRMSSDGVSGVTVTRDKCNADAPGSSGDRNAEADGREIPRLRLYADLTYFPVTSTSPSTPEVNIHTNPLRESE